MAHWKIVPDAIAEAAKPQGQKALAIELTEAEEVHLNESTCKTDLSRIKKGDRVTVRKWFLEEHQRGKALCRLLELADRYEEVLAEAREYLKTARILIALADGTEEDVDIVRRLVQELKRVASESTSDEVAQAGVGVLLPCEEGDLKKKILTGLTDLDLPLQERQDEGTLVVVRYRGEVQGETELHAIESSESWEFKPYARFDEIFKPRSDPPEWDEEMLRQRFPDEPMVKCPKTFDPPWKRMPPDDPRRAEFEAFDRALLERGWRKAMQLHTDGLRSAFENRPGEVRFYGYGSPFRSSGEDVSDSWAAIPDPRDVDEVSALIYLALTGALERRLPRRIALDVNKPGFGLLRPKLRSLGELATLGEEAEELPEEDAEIGSFNLDSRSEKLIWTHGRMEVSAPGRWVKVDSPREELSSSPDSDASLALCGCSLVWAGSDEIPKWVLDVAPDAVLLTDAVRRAVDQERLAAWMSIPWQADQWEERKKLWVGTEPVDEVARRIAEALFRRFRPLRHPFVPWDPRYPMYEWSPAKCLEAIWPHLTSLLEAPLLDDPPEEVVVLLDAIAHGGHWLVRPDDKCEAWCVTLHTAGGALMRLVVRERAEDNNLEAKLKVTRTNEYKKESKVSFGKLVVDIRKFEEAAPSAIAGFGSVRSASVLRQRAERARAQEEEQRLNDDD